MATPIQTQYDVIIVGGGIWGCSIAYYYIRNNPGSKVLLLERNEIGNAATSRAAALLTRIRSKTSFIPLTLETYRVIPELEEILGESLFLNTTGILHIAGTEASERELTALLEIADHYGDPYEHLSPEELQQKAPWLSTDVISKAVWMPEDAYCDPYLLGSFFAKAAMALGATIIQDTEVTELITEGHQVVAVKTKTASYSAHNVVLACGAWNAVLTRPLNIPVAAAPVRSQYWITEKSALFPANSPIVILPDAKAYARPESGALLFGIRENQPHYASPQTIPSDISHYAFSPDKGMQDLSEVIHQLASFFPGIYDVGLQFYIAGFSTYTPDNFLTLGSVPEYDNLMIAGGCVGAGIAVSGGVGHALAELAAGRNSPYDLSSFATDRFGAIDNFSDSWLHQCAAARTRKTSG